ncbi:hypothetical protein MBLNU230_g3390t1 [Neophaeotheca triangularis]
MSRAKTTGRSVARVIPKTRPREATFRQPFVQSQSPLQNKPTDPKVGPKEEHGLPKWAPHGGRAFPWIVASLFAGGMSFYLVRIFQALNQPCNNPDVAKLDRQKDVSSRYEEIADNFDSEVGFSEFLMGINGIRKKLAKQCSGHVLEASCGTGRNLGYYDISKGADVDSLTFVDLSPTMVELCKKKWDALHGNAIKAHQADVSRSNFKPGLSIRFLTGSALGPMPLAPADKAGKKYDTIIQTMGLCSTPDPAALLVNLAAHLDASNPKARILLLEHGRSSRDWLNRALDSSAEKHAEIHGCWFNREIGDIVDEAAARTGLEVVKEKRRHFGTTSIIELKPGQKMIQAGGVSRPSEASVDGQSLGKQGSSGWLSWVGLK